MSTRLSNRNYLIANDDFWQFQFAKAITKKANISIMIVHLGLWKVKRDLSPELLQQIIKHVSDFAVSIKGVEVAYAGPVKSFELPAQIADTYGISRDMSMLARGYTHGLYILFKDEISRRNYDSAPPHLELAPILIPSIEGGMDGVLTIDFSLPS